MAQMTIRADDDLVKRVRRAAEQQGLSMNAYVSHVLNVATSPEYAVSSFERISERFRAAGLLAERSEQEDVSLRPERVAAARKAAGRGTPLSEIVASDRE